MRVMRMLKRGTSRLTFTVLVISLTQLCFLLLYQSYSVRHRTPKHLQYLVNANLLSVTSKTSTVSYEHYHKYIVTSSTCENVTFTPSLLKNDWAPVNGKATMYVYSGYVNIRGPGTVTVVGAVERGSLSYFCQLWYANKTSNTISLETVSASYLTYHNSRERYVSCELTCRLPDHRVPDMVSIVDSDPCRTPLNLHHLITPPVKQYRHNFTVCVSPFNFRYGRAYELIEWMEMNRMLGADKFIFYNFSIAHNVDKVLREYSKRGIAEVLQWSLPMSVQTWPPSNAKQEIAYFGQTASLNECLLRCKLNSRYIVNSDLDEFLIPRRDDLRTWYDVIEKFPLKSVYMFRNVFFRKEWNSSYDFLRKDVAIKYRLTTLLKTLREVQILPFVSRAKYFVKTDDVKILQVHSVKTKVENTQYLLPEDGLLFHYRNWLKYEDKKDRVKDTLVPDRFKDLLINRVVDVWSYLEGVEMDIPI